MGIATAAEASPSDKVLICHGTASLTNLYVLISVDAHALAGHLFGPEGHGQNNAPDKPPASDGTCEGEE